MIYLIFLISLIAVTKGADWLVDGAVGLTNTLGISQIVVGATVVSLGTTLPETLISSFAAYQGKSPVIVGTAFGSILFNAAVILGLAVLLKPPRLAGKEAFYKAGTMIALPILFVLLALDHRISRWDAALLLVILIVYLVSNVIKGRQESQNSQIEKDNGKVLKHIVQLGAGCLTVVLGAKFLLDSGVELARIFGVSEAIIALTLFAIGSSLPELITGITAARKGHTDLVLGNVIGANTLNIIFVIALSGLIKPFAVSSSVLLVDIPLCLAMMGILFIPALFTKRIGRWQGFITISLYILCLIFIIGIK